ncbi:MAG: dUTP diphosphatase [Crocinitomicaceae bacterium]|nr:dUTP diphosphatase [Crocinitomicaceae bacterium]MBP6033728.1 dUTP diphosphatase [Crocinitomicaceae bacterium]
MQVKITNKSKHDLPKYETAGSSGMDIRANMDAEVSLKPLQRALIKTGLFLEMDPSIECQIRPRSGLALKKGLTVLNTPGTVDADYRGEVGVILINLSEEEVVIEDGERIAQMVFCPVQKVTLTEVTELTDSARGAGGFGSTGVK